MYPTASAAKCILFHSLLSIKKNNQNVHTECVFVCHLQDIGVVRINIVHCSDDNLVCMACFLLCPTIPVPTNQR